MFTNEQVKLVVGETLVSVHAVMATMFDFEGGNDPYTVADVIAAVVNPQVQGQTEKPWLSA